MILISLFFVKALLMSMTSLLDYAIGILDCKKPISKLCSLN